MIPEQGTSIGRSWSLPEGKVGELEAQYAGRKPTGAFCKLALYGTVGAFIPTPNTP
jgi:hypothetical protein